MARVCKVTGTILSILGVALALAFMIGIARDAEYQRAALARERNPGNVMYDAEFKGAQVRRAFEAIGVIVGILLVINGTTLLGLGVLADRVPRKKRDQGSVPPDDTPTNAHIRSSQGPSR